MVKRNRVPKDASPEFEEVMKGARKGNPEFEKNQKARDKKAAASAKAQRKTKGTRRKGDNGGGIDTGMFSS